MMFKKIFNHGETRISFSDMPVPSNNYVEVMVLIIADYQPNVFNRGREKIFCMTAARA
jgi:hypothetical protein